MFSNKLINTTVPQIKLHVKCSKAFSRYQYPSYKLYIVKYLHDISTPVILYLVKYLRGMQSCLLTSTIVNCTPLITDIAN